MSSVTQDPKFEEVRRLAARMPGQRLPGERELAERFAVSRSRVRAILSTLEGEGLVRRHQGSGTYAVDPNSEAGPLRRVALLIDRDLKLGDDPFFTRVVERLQDEFQQRGVQCLIGRADAQQLHSGGADGVLTLGAAGHQVLSDWSDSDPPLVSLFLDVEAQPRKRISLLQLDDRNAGRKAARRLLEAGCAHAFFVGRRTVPAARERFEGVAGELAPSGIRLRVIECPLHYAAGLEAGRRLELPPEGRVGIVAANDWLAVGLHAGLLTHGPEDVGRTVRVSFDGLALAREPSLGIHSLAVPIEEMARDAVEELVRLRNRKTVGRVIRYPMDWADGEESG